MKRTTICALLIFVFVTSSLYGQGPATSGEAERDRMNQLLDGVNKRIHSAAEAANYALKANEHRREAQRLASAGHREEARAEFQRAVNLIAAASDGDASMQADPLLQDYAAELQTDLRSLYIPRGIYTGSTDQRIAPIRTAYPFIESILVGHDLPSQLAAIVMVESAGNVFALSPKGARGIWQLMPDTARRYGLRVDEGIDERVDPLKSTYAAVRYLRYLYTMFGNWPLALAAYNAGERRIAQIISRSDVRDFWTMLDQGLLPNETSRYVPSVLTAAPGLAMTTARKMAKVTGNQ